MTDTPYLGQRLRIAGRLDASAGPSGRSTARGASGARARRGVEVEAPARALDVPFATAAAAGRDVRRRRRHARDATGSRCARGVDVRGHGRCRGRLPAARRGGRRCCCTSRRAGTRRAVRRHEPIRPPVPPTRAGWTADAATGRLDASTARRLDRRRLAALERAVLRLASGAGREDVPRRSRSTRPSSSPSATRRPRRRRS